MERERASEALAKKDAEIARLAENHREVLSSLQDSEALGLERANALAQLTKEKAEADR